MTTNSVSQVVMFTRVYPYGGKEVFLDAEVAYLAAKFTRITIVPGSTPAPLRPVPANVEVDTSFAHSYTSGLKRIMQAAAFSLTSDLFYRELRRHPHIRANPHAISRLIKYLYHAKVVYQWLLPRLQAGTFDHALIYTVWLLPETIGIRLAQRQYPQLKLVSRAHRIDLYADVSQPPYLPLQGEGVRAAARIFVISEHGRAYLKEHYHEEAICEVSRLGTHAPGFSITSRDDTIFRVVSVSRLIEHKRTALLIESLARLAALNPALQIEWHHFGDGALRDSLEAQAGQILNGKVRWQFHGLVPNADLFKFYETQAPDVFISVSASEGIPVSIMEAQSCGIAVIATNVGATAESVSGDNGILLDANPDVETVALALKRLAENAQLKRDLGAKGKQHWAEFFDAECNCRNFAERLYAIVHER